VEPLLVSELINVPIFEALTIVFASCFIITVIRLTLTNRWQIVLQQKWYIWLFGIVTICGSDFCYLMASHLAPISHVDLIDYLWPCLFVVFIGFLPKEKFRTYSVIGALLGLIGVLQLCLADNVVLDEYKNNYRMLGYGIALIGITLWSLYSLFSRYKAKIPSDMMGIYCGFGALISLMLHFLLEGPTVVPNRAEFSMAVILGLAGPGLAYQLWDYGVKYGSVSILSTGCYAARVCALSLLVFFDKEPFSQELVIACILAIAGMLVGNIDKINFKRYLNPRWLAGLLLGTKRLQVK
jgi:drug/metabolite transporter (DMT)-like permease